MADLKMDNGLIQASRRRNRGLLVFQKTGSLTMGEIGWVATVLLLLFGFFTPISFPPSVFYAWLAVIALLSFIKISSGVPKTFGAGQWFCLGLLCLAGIALYYFNEYGGGYALRVLVVVIGAYLLIGVLDVAPPRYAESLFYGVASVLLALMLIFWVLQPSLFAHMGGVDKSDDLAPLIYGELDKNWTALFVFLYFAYSIKGRKKIGIFLGLAYPFAYMGRQYLMMLAFLLVAFFLMRVRKGYLEHGISAALSKPTILLILFAASGIIVSVLSYLWVTYVIPTGIVGYKTGLNDGSNAMRMASINYVINRVCSDSAFLYRGFDQSVFNALGINTVETGYGKTYYIMGLYRLVQPHNEVINMLVKEGLIFTVLYYGAVSNILAKLVDSRLNATILISFLIGCLFLHQMFTCQTLLLLIFVLASGRSSSINVSVKSGAS